MGICQLAFFGISKIGVVVDFGLNIAAKDNAFSTYLSSE